MAVDLLNLSQVSQIITEIESTENRDRKTDEWRSYQIYSGNQRKYVLDELRKLFPETHTSMRVSNINIEKKVVDKRARAYKDKVVRALNGKPSETLDEVYEGFDKAYAQFDTSYNRHKNSLMWVQNDPLMPTRFRLLALNPYSFDLVINNDTFEVEAVILSYPDETITRETTNIDNSKKVKSDGVNQGIAEGQDDSSPDTKIYTMWSNENHVVVRSTRRVLDDEVVTHIDYVLDENNPKQINPIGIIPFRWKTMQPDVPEFPISSPLPFESININILESDLLTASAMQGFGQLVLKYPEGSQIKQVHSGFNVALELPQKADPDAPETDANFINANPDLNGMREVINNYAEAVISDQGLMNFSLAGSNKQFTSGLDRAIAMADVTEIREENIAVYQDLEKEVFEIIKRYDLVNGTRLFKEDDEISVVFPKPKILMNEKEQLEIIEKKVDRGWMSDEEAVMKFDPTLSKEDAEEKLSQIAEKKKEKADKFLSRMRNANNQEPERQEAESQE